MPRLHSILSQLYRAEGASLFRYLADSPSYISPAANRWMPALHAMGRASNERLSRLEAFLDAADENYNPISFPSSFASLHYISMDYLLGRLMADKRSLVAAYAKAAQSLEQTDAVSITPPFNVFIRETLAAQMHEEIVLQMLPKIKS